MKRLKPFIKAIEYTACSDSYNCTLSLGKGGSIVVEDNQTKEVMPMKQWLQKQDDAQEQIIENILEELQEQLYEQNNDYFDFLKGEEYQLLLRYRRNKYGEGDDDSDEERYEQMFIRDQSYYDISLKQLVADLVKERNKGLRKYSDKTKEKARKLLREWLEICNYSPWGTPAETMEELLQETFDDEDGDYFYEFSGLTPDQIARKAIENYPILCSSSFREMITERISDESTSENLCQYLLGKLKEAFPQFYKKVKQCAEDDRESAYCIVKLKDAHLFKPLYRPSFKTKMLCLFQEEILAGKNWVPWEDTLYSAKDYIWLIQQIPNMTLGPTKYYYAD